MGKILDFGFKPEHSQPLSARAHMAAPKQVIPTDKVIRQADEHATGA
jgi:hypothetical protein